MKPQFFSPQLAQLATRTSSSRPPPPPAPLSGAQAADATSSVGGDVVATSRAQKAHPCHRECSLFSRFASGSVFAKKGVQSAFFRLFAGAHTREEQVTRFCWYTCQKRSGKPENKMIHKADYLFYFRRKKDTSMGVLSLISDSVAHAKNPEAMKLMMPNSRS